MWRKRNPYAIMVGLWTGAVTMKNSMEVLQKLKIEMPYEPVIPPMAIHPKEMKTLCETDICTLMFTAALFIDEWYVHKLYMYTHTHTQVLYEQHSAIKKKKILLFATTCMDLKGTKLSAISKTEKDKHYIISLLHRI